MSTTTSGVMRAEPSADMKHGYTDAWTAPVCVSVNGLIRSDVVGLPGGLRKRMDVAARDLCATIFGRALLENGKQSASRLAFIASGTPISTGR